MHVPTPFSSGDGEASPSPGASACAWFDRTFGVWGEDSEADAADEEYMKQIVNGNYAASFAAWGEDSDAEAESLKQRINRNYAKFQEADLKNENYASCIDRMHDRYDRERCFDVETEFALIDRLGFEEFRRLSEARQQARQSRRQATIEQRIARRRAWLQQRQRARGHELRKSNVHIQRIADAASSDYDSAHSFEVCSDLDSRHIRAWSDVEDSSEDSSEDSTELIHQELAALKQIDCTPGRFPANSDESCDSFDESCVEFRTKVDAIQERFQVRRAMKQRRRNQKSTQRHANASCSMGAGSSTDHHRDAVSCEAASAVSGSQISQRTMTTKQTESRSMLSGESGSSPATPRQGRQRALRQRQHAKRAAARASRREQSQNQSGESSHA